MLLELGIQNLALVDDLRLPLGPGFTVLTGETGAGKSIIIDGLNAVLGVRMGSDMIRSGAPSATVEAIFDTADAPRALAALEAAGLRGGDDTTVILSREVGPERSTYRTNRRAATLGLVQDISRHLVDIHGQHEHQTLIHEENHLAFLDSAGDARHQALRSAYEAAWAAFECAVRDLEALHLDERERAQRVDMLRFQVQEIRAAELSPDEEDRLGTERLRLQHAERIREAVATALELLDGETGDGLPALAALQTATHELISLKGVEAGVAITAEELQGASVVVAEAVRSLGAVREDLEADPDRLEQIETRLAELGRLKRKYGDTLAQVIEFGARAEAELSAIENVETHAKELAARVERCREAAGEAARALTASRAKLGQSMGKTVTRELGGLGMDAARFGVSLALVQDPAGLPGPDEKRYRASRRGMDDVRFLFSANAGEELRPLSKVASGGELSRLMLVLKSVCSRGAEIATIVFDEVDAGIGGRVAHAVGERLAALSQTAQVLCVTHLAQIARLADRHIHVSKHVQDGRTVVRARELTGEERVDEVARMLGGAEGEATAREHARQLLAREPQARATS